MDDKLKKAINYALNNPTLSFHHTATKFDVSVSKLQNETAKAFHAKRNQTQTKH